MSPGCRIVCCVLLGLLTAAGQPARAANDADGSISVRVADRDGNALPEAVVYAVPASARAREVAVRDPTPGRTATMNQRGRAFVPHILVVQTDTLIDFPNSDDVRHHVYSFSPAKRFELALYRGRVHDPVQFPEPGLVTLGCNIHDGMLGYILVVDTPYFGKTGADGTLRVESLPPGDYEIRVWTPRQRPDRMPDAVEVPVAAGQTVPVEFEFADSLFPPHAHSDTSLIWNHY